MSYTCPRHNKPMKFWDNSAAGKPDRWTCPTKLGSKNGKAVYCDYGSSDEFQALLEAESAPAQPAPQAAPRPAEAAPVTAPGSPRLQAAIAAMDAVARVHQGSGRHVADLIYDASTIYHEFFKPAFHGELPLPKPPDKDLPF